MTRTATADNTVSFSIADLKSSIDGIPRILDLTIASALGFSNLHMIRKLISRHNHKLMRFGEVVSMVEKTSPKGGRPGKAYYLNKKQALYICTKSETENATEVTIEMVEVFDAYTSGKPVHVREHDRRTSTKVDDAIRLKKNIDRLETVVASIQPQAPNFCAMVIDGEHVFVDTNRFYGVGRAVVIGADDRMRIEYVDTSGSHGLSRSTFGPWYSKGRGKARDGLIVVGMVMEPAMRAAPVVDAVRHEITSLLEAGPFTDQQIARRLVCAPSLVRDVRREHSLRNRSYGLAISG